MYRKRSYSKAIGGVAGKIAGYGAAFKSGMEAGKRFKSIIQTVPATEKATNADTRHNLNDTYNTVSVYSKAPRKLKRKSKASKARSKKKRVFKKKVVKSLQTYQPWSVFKLNFSDTLSDTQALSTPAYVSQFLSPPTAASFPISLGLGWGYFLTSTKDQGNIYNQLAGLGHAEDGVVVADNVTNTPNLEYYINARCTVNIKFISPFLAGGAAPTGETYLYDVYECVANRSMGSGDVAYNLPQKAWDTCLAECGVPTDAGATLANSSVYKGSRPSDCPQFGKYWKVEEITRIAVNTVGESFQFNMKTSGKISQRTSATCYTLKGITKCLFVVGNPCGNPTNYATASINYQNEKTFKFKALNGNTGGPVNSVPRVQWNYQRLTTV